MDTGIHITHDMRRAAVAVEKEDIDSIAGTVLNLSELLIFEGLKQKGLSKYTQDSPDVHCFHLNLTRIGRLFIGEAFYWHNQNSEQNAAVVNRDRCSELSNLHKRASS